MHNNYTYIIIMETIENVEQYISGSKLNIDNFISRNVYRKAFGLMILFAYDYMHLSHICISELIETGKITEKNMWKLKSIVF